MATPKRLFFLRRPSSRPVDFLKRFQFITFDNPSCSDFCSDSSLLAELTNANRSQSEKFGCFMDCQQLTFFDHLHGLIIATAICFSSESRPLKLSQTTSKRVSSAAYEVEQKLWRIARFVSRTSYLPLRDLAKSPRAANADMHHIGCIRLDNLTIPRLAAQQASHTLIRADGYRGSPDYGDPRWN